MGKTHWPWGGEGTDGGVMESGRVCMLADEDTLNGFLLSGIGELNPDSSSFLRCDSETPIAEIEAKFEELVERGDVALILISQGVADKITELIASHLEPVPA